jgi:prepilin-type processing-associated H-X9-DG protein
MLGEARVAQPPSAGYSSDHPRGRGCHMSLRGAERRSNLNPMDGRLLRCARNGKPARGGTIIDVVTVVIILVLVGMGVWWVIKAWGQAGQQYTEGMINTKNRATELACMSNLQAIGQTILAYAVSEENYPPSQEALMQYGSYSPRRFRCPDPNGSEYVYIPGQRGDMPASNVLVYETKPVHDGKCNVLFLGGQIEALTPEQLKQAVDATLARLRQ